MAAQLIAAHHAAMECFRRAMLSEQTFEGRRENLGEHVPWRWRRACSLALERREDERGIRATAR
jgi:hypothetical protein